MEQWKQRLKSAREAKGLNKTEFRKLVGVSSPTVTDWEKSVETGGIKEITGPRLLKACQVLGITVDYLYSGKEAPPPSPQLTDSLRLTIETAEELRLLTAYRIADKLGRKAFDATTDSVLERMKEGARNKR
ncbi:MAG: helix-turn-helix transcriptional regulator [Pseudomonadota bacterium]